MQNLPPHLPKKTSTENSSTVNRSLFYFISFTLISIAASLATVFVALSWIVPRAVPEVRFYTFEHEETKAEIETIDEVVVDRIHEREVKLYDKTKMLEKTWYPIGSLLSTGVFLTSDGWAVFPLSSVSVVDKKNFDIVDSRGLSYAVEEMFFDTTLQLLYVKVGGDGFRFVSFAPWDIVNPGSDLLVKKENFYEQVHLETGDKNPRFGAADAVWKPLFVSALETENLGPVFTLQGELSGFSSPEKTFIPGWFVQNTLLSLLSEQTLTLSAFTWKGEIIENVNHSGVSKNGIGFYITEIPVEKNKSDILVHDVIVKIGGNEFTALNLSKVILESPEIVELQIIREGKLIEKMVPKQIIKLD